MSRDYPTTFGSNDPDYPYSVTVFFVGSHRLSLNFQTEEQRDAEYKKLTAKHGETIDYGTCFVFLERVAYVQKTRYQGPEEKRLRGQPL